MSFTEKRHLPCSVVFALHVLVDARVAEASLDKLVKLRDKLALEACFVIVWCVIISLQLLGSFSFYCMCD